MTRRAAVLSWAADCALLFIATALLLGPLFTISYTTNWESIESTFIADARFLLDYWPHPNWQPLWYGGTRWDYIYPPALRYGTAIVSRLFGVETVVGYHAYTSFLYCLGIVGVYVLTRVGTGSRRCALLAAAASALISPSYLFMPEMRHSAPWLAPQRIRVLIRYGEGPHVSSFCILGFALAASYRALERFRPAALAVAALCCAAVVAHNFYGATALAIFFPILVWSMWLAYRDFRIVLRAGAIAALAYGLTAYWLVPSYFRVTAENLMLVASPGTAGSKITVLIVVVLFVVGSARWANRRRERLWAVFVAGSLLLYALNVLGHIWWGFRVTGEPIRLTPELDLSMILAGVLALRWLWHRTPPRYFCQRAMRMALVLVIAVGFLTSRHYVRHAWQLAEPDPSYRDRVEYRIADWVAKHAPNDRNYVMGAVRFWYDTWSNLAQIGGGSEQGVLNQKIVRAFWEVRLAPHPRASVLWLQCLGTDLVTVSDARSEDPYHDFPYAQKFDGVLPVVFDDGKGNRIYRVPRRYPGLARVVRTSDVETLGTPRQNGDVERLQPYADAVEKGPDTQPRFEWHGSDEMRIRARYSEGQSLLVQEAYDPNWRAEANGRGLAIRPDALGQMLVATPPGEYDVRLTLPMPAENRVGWVVTAASGISLAVLIALGLRKA